MGSSASTSPAPIGRAVAPSLVVLLVGLGTFLDGYDLLNISVALPLLSKFMHLSPALSGLLGTATYLGGIAGGLAFGLLSDLRGRRNALLADLAFFLIASLLSAFVESPLQLLVLRVLIGFGIGADIASGPALLSEVSPSSSRGLLMGLSLVMMPLGGLVSAALAYGMWASGVAPAILWRILLGAGAVPAAAVIILRSRLPESPMWIERGARGRRTRTYGDLARRYWRMLAYASVAWVGAGTTSIFTIFTPMVVSSIGGGYQTMLRVVLVLWTLATLGGLAGALLMDRVGRRPLLAAALAALGASFWAVAAGYRTPALEAALAAGMFATFLSVSGAYTVQTEVFPVEVKSLADGVAFSLNRIANFAFGAVAPAFLMAGLMPQYLTWVGAFALASGVAAAALGVESSRRELE
ncbi:MAG: MFS transporter [Conexivisphaera sp.]